MLGIGHSSKSIEHQHLCKRDTSYQRILKFIYRKQTDNDMARKKRYWIYFFQIYLLNTRNKLLVYLQTVSIIEINRLIYICGEYRYAGNTSMTQNLETQVMWMLPSTTPFNFFRSNRPTYQKLQSSNHCGRLFFSYTLIN